MISYFENRNAAAVAAAAVAIALASCATASSEHGRLGVPVGDLDLKVDPCTNFYDFSNGGWRAANPIPAGKPHWGPRDVLREANKGRLHDLLEEISAKKDWPQGSTEQLVSDYYASCMDEAGIDGAGVTPLAPLLAEIDRMENLADVQRAIRKLHQLSVPAIFSIAGGMDTQEPVNFIANLVAGSLGLPDRDYYLKPDARFEEARAKYRVHIARILKLGGMPEAQTAPAAEAVFALEKRLAEASLESAAAADPAISDHKMSFAQLQQLAPGFDWDGYFAEAKLSRADLNVAEWKLLQQFDRELRATSIAEWKIFLTWQLLDSASPSLSKAFAAESFDFKDKFLGGAAEEEPRAQRCAESTEAQLIEPLGKKYAERYFPPALKARVLEMIHSMSAVLKEEVAKAEWMTKETKRKAFEKLATWNPQIGYPDQWKDTSSITIHRDAFWANVAAGRRFNIEDNRKQIGKPTDRNLWQAPPSSTFAYLDLQLNQFVLPAGFLQPPIFRPEATDAVNYGTIGASIAHDMTHPIDLSGSELDPMGRPKNWWSDADRAELAKRGQCVGDQFEGFSIEPGIHLQGKLVQSEAIADLAGVRIAYLAFERSMEGNPGPAIDGFTPEQQFFIAFGQARADSMRPEAARQMVKTDIHPVSKFRVLGTLANSPEFQQAFSCKAGAEMVRREEIRCAIW